MTTRRPSNRPSSRRPRTGQARPSDRRSSASREASRADDSPRTSDSASRHGSGADQERGQQAASGGRTAPRGGDRRQEQRRPGTRRSQRGPRREYTKRSVIVPGSRGPRQISLRLLAIAFFAIVAVIGIAPTFTKYMAQRQELRDLTSQLADVRAHNEELQKELDLWNDPEYVTSQARERLGFVLPGQTLYVVTDPDKGTAQEQLQAKVDSANKGRRAATPWFATLWDSVSVAGNSGGADNPNDAPIIEDTHD